MISDGADRADRLEFLQTSITRLWPGCSVRFHGSPRGEDKATSRSFLLLASMRRPRLLTPARTARVAVRAHATHLTAGASVRTWLLSAALATGVARPLAGHVHLEGVQPGQGIDDHLSSILDEQVDVVLHITGRRPNRKPILQAIDRAGRIRAFVKVGTDAVTADLVTREADALRTVAAARPVSFVAPAVIDLREWRGLHLLILAPLPTWRRSHVAPAARVRSAQAELATWGADTETALAESAYWLRTRARIDALAPGPAAADLTRLANLLERRHGGTLLHFSAVHGDWAPWNMCVASGSLLVWDWERFEPHAPRGFDELHYLLHDRLVRRRWTPARAAEACRADAPRVLRQLGDPVERAGALAAAYLLSLGLRYRAGGDDADTSALGDLQAALHRAVARSLVARAQEPEA